MSQLFHAFWAIKWSNTLYQKVVFDFRLTSNMLPFLFDPTEGLLAPLELDWSLLKVECVAELAKLSRYTEVGNTRLDFRSIVSMWLLPVNQLPSLARLLSSCSLELELLSSSELFAFNSRMCFLEINSSLDYLCQF